MSCKDNLQGKVKVTGTEVVPESKYTATLGVVMADIEIIPATDTISVEDSLVDLAPAVIKGDVSIQINKDERPLIETPVLMKGIIVDEEDKPIPMANINARNLLLPIVSDSLGHFSIILKPDQDVFPVEIEISSVGYKTKKINYVILDSSLLIVKLEKDIKVLDTATVNANVFTKGFVVTGNAVCKKPNEVPKNKDLELQSLHSIKVFPNPLKSGTAMNIEWKQSESDTYLFQLLNQSGQLVFQESYGLIKKQEYSVYRCPQLLPVIIS